MAEELMIVLQGGGRGFVSGPWDTDREKNIEVPKVR